MIKATRPTPAERIPELEERLCELAPSSWALVVNRLTGEGALEGYFEEEKQAHTSWRDLADLFEGDEAAAPFSLTKMEDRDWREAYKDHFQPWSLGKLHLVPEWERASYEVPAEHVALYLDPGMAFGTGLHETTRLCLGELIAFANKNPVPNSTCLDVGCGSGILALSAKMLGFGQSAGFDFDPDAVRISRENAVANGMGKTVAFYEAILPDGAPADGADLVLANVRSDVLGEHVEPLLRAVRSGGTLALSGILAIEAEEVASRFQAVIEAEERLNARAFERRDDGEWTLLVYRDMIIG